MSNKEKVKNLEVKVSVETFTEKGVLINYESGNFSVKLPNGLTKAELQSLYKEATKFFAEKGIEFKPKINKNEQVSS